MARYSVQTIMRRLDLTEPKARAAKALMEGRLSPDKYPSVVKWVNQCYNEPRRCEKVMCALNELLGGLGAEAIRGWHVDDFFFDCVASYVNMGDTYDTTILRNNVTGDYQITCWGDWVERNGRRYGVT